MQIQTHFSHIKMSRCFITNIIFALILFFSCGGAFATVDSASVPEINTCGAGAIDYDSAVKFVRKLQEAVRNENKEAVADLIHYPLEVNIRMRLKSRGFKVKIHYVKNRNIFIKNYNKYLPAYMQEDILKHNPKDVFCKDYGGMITGGAVWFNIFVNDLKVNAILLQGNY